MYLHSSAENVNECLPLQCLGEASESFPVICESLRAKAILVVLGFLGLVVANRASGNFECPRVGKLAYASRNAQMVSIRVAEYATPDFVRST